MLVDSKGILLFLPLRLCSFFIFFSFSISSFGLFNLRTKLLAFLSIKALRLAIFSIISLNLIISTVNSGGQENLLRRGEGSMYRGCFHRQSGRENSFFGFSRSYGHYFCLSLDGDWCTYGENVFRLISNFFQDVFMLLVKEVFHFFDTALL